MHILDFPDEIIEHILGLSEPNTVQCCQQTCRKIRSLIADSLFLTYLHLLGVLGYALPANPRSDLTLDECIVLLQEHRRAWSRNTAPAPTVVELVRYVWPPLVIRYAGGVFAYNYPLDYPYIAGSLHFYQPALKNTSAETKKWSFENLAPDNDVNVLDYWVEPTYDLLILLTECTSWAPYETCSYKIFLRTMSTNEAHPGALVPVLPVELESSTVSLTGPGSFEVLGDILVVRFWGRSSWIIIWDWYRGVEVTRLYLSHIFTFALLSQWAILIPQYLSVYHRPASPGSESLIEGVYGSLDVYTFDPLAEQSVAPRLTASFSLPPLGDAGYNGSKMVISREYGPTSTATPELSQPKVYDWSPQHRWITILVTLDGGGLPESDGILCVPLDLFLSLVYNRQIAYISDTGLSQAPCPLIIPWDAWGDRTIWANSSTGEASGSRKDSLVGNRLVIARGLGDSDDGGTNNFVLVNLDQVQSQSRGMFPQREAGCSSLEVGKVGGDDGEQTAQHIFCAEGGSMPTSRFERVVHLEGTIATQTMDDIFVDGENCEYNMHPW